MTPIEKKIPQMCQFTAIGQSSDITLVFFNMRDYATYTTTLLLQNNTRDYPWYYLFNKP